MSAKARRSERQRVADIETWDPQANGGEGTFVKMADASGDAHFTGETPDTNREEKARRQALKGGNLNLAELAALDRKTVSRINPKSDVPRKILKGALKSSWKFAKKALVSNKWGGLTREQKPDDANLGKTVMKKIWEFRQWDHQQLLDMVGARLAKTDPAGTVGLDLEKTSASGSTTVTSDIDVNLKGARTEEAATLFNKLFKTSRGGWQYESGVVYDVNVYALDVLHGKYKENEGTPQEVKRSKKEGSRSGKEGGGFKANSAVQLKDSQNQDIQAMLHMRIFMNQSQWNSYSEQSLRDGAKRRDLIQVERRFAQYQKEIRDEMLKEAGVLDSRTSEAAQKAFEDPASNGEQQIEAVGVALKGGNHIEGENAMMAASNRIYERKTARVAELRANLAKVIKDFEAEKAPEAEVEEVLYLLREAISEMLLYANEVYITDASVNHAVLGTQANLGITQTIEESRRVVQENAGDVLKEVAHYKPSWEKAGFKAGKYLWRLADGAKNMDTGDFAQYLAPHRHLINKTHAAGEHIANNIKVGMASDGEEAQIAKTALVLTKVADISSISDLQNRATDLSLKVNAAFRAYQQADGDRLANAAKVAGQPERYRD